MSNLDIYEKAREVPEEAQKPITAGRLRGMTDINPMWRIKKLTELFGAAGIGWYFSDVTFDVRQCGDETVVNCMGLLNIKNNGEWQPPIFGVGGSKLITKESKGLYVDDEAYKKAYTDMMSVACKSLGMGADVYWNRDSTKYTTPNDEQHIDYPSNKQYNNRPSTIEQITPRAVTVLNEAMAEHAKADREQAIEFYAQLKKKYKIKSFKDVKPEQYGEITKEIMEWKPKQCEVG